MSDRDELAAIIYDMTDDDEGPPTMEKCRSISDVLICAGWRKMPSAAELTDCIISVDDQRDTDVLVATILDLLEGERCQGWPPPLDSEPSAFYNIQSKPTNTRLNA